MGRLEEILEEYLTASPARKRDCFNLAVKALKAELAAERFEEAASGLARMVAVDLDYPSARTLIGLRERLQGRVDTTGPSARLAILGGFTTTQLASLIELFLFAAGAKVEILESEYGIFRQDILDPNSPLYRFHPNLVYIAVGRHDLRTLPSLGEDAQGAREWMDTEFSQWAGLWEVLQDRLGCQIIQNNFDPPPWRVLGNYETTHPSSPSRLIQDLNRKLADEAPAHVLVHDVGELAAAAGRWAWGDTRYYFEAKLPCAPELLVDYAHSVASLVLSQLGLGKKCLVTDLDNTLWGGVIGDDGLGGIRLGHGSGEGEAYVEFQRHLKGLQSRGVILAVCSKNSEELAREPFEKHPEMALRLEDISCFVANWEDKAANLRAIARTLDIGLNSLVFVDDNPMERALVRRLAPEVAVPEIPEDPAGFIRALEKHRYFQVTSLAGEDFRRTDFYRANAERREAESAAGSLDEFLGSLRMTAKVAPIDSTNLERCVQLIQRSNQFNLTTRRRASGEVLALVEDSRWVTVAVSLADRFGDHGLISVVLARLEGEVFRIDTWLMSCRVLKRGVERFLLNHLVSEAGKRGAEKLIGEYIPTAKNGLVRDHYSDLGFTRIGEEQDGSSRWELDITGGWTPLPTHIEEMQANG
ncbi:MAG: hypothetical protein GHCLOJNM_00352 [bacterium]|nr:hypothetical protein [bacterium]